MTRNTGEPPNDMPVTPEVGRAVDGRRWNGTTWEPAGAEGVASVTAPPPPEQVQ